MQFKKGGLEMGIFSWIIVGGLAGFIASKIMTGEGSGLLMNIIIGIIGAFLGGLIVSVLGGQGVSGFNIWSIFVSVIGAVVLLGIVRLFKGGNK